MNGFFATRVLPGTDDFIQRVERIRAWNYTVRADSQAALPPPIEPAGSAAFGNARIWFTGARARVHLLDEASLEQLPAIEAWLAERGLDALFDVLPIVACRPVARALGERGYRLAAWQPLLYHPLSSAADPTLSAVAVEELPGEDAEFRSTFLRGYELPESELPDADRIMEARWRSENARRFLARIGGKPVAAATLVVHDGVARLANCATLPGSRGMGAQSALIRARLQAAAESQIEIAIADARQGGGSLRNLARAGFVVCAQVTQWGKGAE